MKERLRLLAVVVLVSITTVTAQENVVRVNPTVQKFIGETSQLNRTKYFVIHSSGKDEDHQEFYRDYNVVPCGRGFYGPGIAAKKKTGAVGKYPKIKASKQSELALKTSRFVGTEHPRNVYKEGVDIDAFANWAVDYFKSLKTEDRPVWYEPMNEPFVHAKDFYDEKDWDPVAEVRVKTEMSELYNAVASKFKQEPSLKAINVIGFGSAWPSFELKDFNNWEMNMKLFLDIAGENLDGISYHLYDGINQAGQDNKRSGSNNEAIMDLIENYSFSRWGFIKPHAITEYGGIAKKEYSDIKNVQSIRSQNNMIFGLLDREDRLDISLPFTEGKATWHLTKANNYLPYKAVLWKPINMGVPKNEITGWEYTDRIYFYDLWKSVEGKRVKISTSNPDIQTQAFVKGNKLYLALNNLDDLAQEVTIDFQSLGREIKQIHKKSLTVYKEKVPVFENKKLKKSTKTLEIKFGETIVLEYTFKKAIEFKAQIVKKRYYSLNYLEPITSNKAIDFEYSKVNTDLESASLSMSIGRKHKRSKQPIVKVNGTVVEIPTNWEGYDQSNRKDFFGMIEIPVPVNLLKKNNTVSVSFPDSTGHLSTLVLNTTAIKA